MLAYKAYGQGLPVVLLHAFPLSSKMWEKEARSLEKSFQVITPDLPGFGGSVRQAQPSIPRMAEEVAALLDHLEIKTPVFMGGLSMGGYVAFEFLRQFPQRLAGLGLFSTRPASDTLEGRQKRMATIESIKKKGISSFTEKVILNLIGKTTRETKPGVARQIKEMILENSEEGITDALHAMAARRDSQELLDKISCPALVIAGGEDTFVSLKEAESYAENIPRARLTIMKRVGHLANLEDPDVFQNHLQNFLRSSLPLHR